MGVVVRLCGGVCGMCMGEVSVSSGVCGGDISVKDGVNGDKVRMGVVLGWS